MGLEAKCRASFGGRRSEGTARLETDVLVFSGDFRLNIPFRSIRRIEAARGTLAVDIDEGRVVLHLGPAAERWAERVRSPKGVLDKLGVKAGARVATVGAIDAALSRDLKVRAGSLSAGRLGRDHDLIFFAVTSNAELQRLAALKTHLVSHGAIWVVRPKGRRDITEAGVMAAARAAGLVDVKVVKLSDTHTAEKLVIPVKARVSRA